MNRLFTIRTEERKGLKIHGTVTILVIALLAAINLLVVPEFLWFLFPLTGMSIGLLIHFLLVRTGK